MTRARTFDPPLSYAEIARIYDFTERLMKALGLATSWRLQIADKPCSASSYATITPVENKNVGDLELNPGWELYDLEGERIPTLIHEVLHLTHRELTDLFFGDIHQYVGALAWYDLEKRYKRGIELWVDHMTQFVLGVLRPEWEVWAAEIWGESWQDIGDSTSAGQRAARGETA